LKIENFPSNDTTAGLAEGLAEAHKVYGVPGACILFVVQAGERNVFDQRWLEYELLEKHSIRVIRQTFDELAHSATLDPSTSALLITSPPGVLPTPSIVEISTVYFRAGYTPTDYPNATQWSTRFLLERSRAIKCPSIPLQLAGGKKVQQVLTKPGILEGYLCDEEKWGKVIFRQDEVDEVRASWMGMWGLDDSRSATGEEDGISKARRLATSLVLKPQREGGGNNIYKDAIPAFLDALPPKDREAWIAMELIVPPEGTSNYLVRAGGGGEAAVRTEVVSELGIFGWALFGARKEDIKEKEVGWLVRTKGKDNNEGGVAAGFSVLDSLVLIDD
jgi:glutathione synthase